MVAGSTVDIATVEYSRYSWRVYKKPVQPKAVNIIAPTTITLPEKGLILCTWEFENGATVEASYTAIEGPWEVKMTLANGQGINIGPLPYTYQLQAWVQWAALLPPTRHALAEHVLEG